VSDHRHESYDVYGLDSTSQDAREALALAGGLRQDLAAAEGRIRDLENELDRQVRRLWTHIGNMPGGI
jgi:hypothetical protein